MFLLVTMPDRCVVYGCSNQTGFKNISLHRIPYFNDDSSVGKRRRNKWVTFVQRRRDKWTPTSKSVVCSEHFTPDSFEVSSDTVSTYKKRRLKRDQIGIIAIPSIYTNADTSPQISQRSEHKRVSIVNNLSPVLNHVYQHIQT